MPLTVRPAYPQDRQFLYDLIYQVTAEKLLASTWDPRIRHQLLDLQVRARDGSYAAAHPKADHGIVMLDDKPVGRLLVDRSGEFYDLVDIAILPKHRSSGIGTRVILGLCMEAGLSHKNVRLYVSTTNTRAMELYKRLGFRVIEDLQSDLLMERTPADQAQVIAAP